MVKKYIVWNVPNHPRGCASLGEFIKGNYGWVMYIGPLFGSEVNNEYISLLECADADAPKLNGIIKTLFFWNVREITDKRAAFLARMHNPPRADIEGKNFGYPYLDADGMLRQDETHTTKDVIMQSDDLKETKRDGRTTDNMTSLQAYSAFLKYTDAETDNYIETTAIDIPAIKAELKTLHKMMKVAIKSAFVDVDGFYK